MASKAKTRMSSHLTQCPASVLAVGAGGVEEMREAINDDMVCWAILRFQVGSGNFSRTKFVSLIFHGNSVPFMRKGLLTQRTKDIVPSLGQVHATVDFHAKEEVTIDTLCERVLPFFVSDAGIDSGLPQSAQTLKQDYEAMLTKRKLSRKKSQIMSAENVTAKEKKDKISMELAVKAVASKSGPYNWLLLEPTQTGLLDLMNAGYGGLLEMKTWLEPDKILFGAARFTFGWIEGSKIVKHVFVHWVGPKVSAVKRGKLNLSLATSAFKMVREQCVVCLRKELHTSDDLELEDIIKEIKRLCIIDGSLDTDASPISVEEYLASLQREQEELMKSAEGGEVTEVAADDHIEQAAPPLPSVKTAVETVRAETGQWNWAVIGIGDLKDADEDESVKQVSHGLAERKSLVEQAREKRLSKAALDDKRPSKAPLPQKSDAATTRSSRLLAAGFAQAKQMPAKSKRKLKNATTVPALRASLLLPSDDDDEDEDEDLASGDALRPSVNLKVADDAAPPVAKGKTKGKSKEPTVVAEQPSTEAQIDESQLEFLALGGSPRAESTKKHSVVEAKVDEPLSSENQAIAEPNTEAKGKGKSKGKGSANDNSVVEAKVDEVPSSETQAAAEPIADAKGKGKAKGKGSPEDNTVVEAKVDEAPSSETQAVAEPIADAKGKGKSKGKGSAKDNSVVEAKVDEAPSSETQAVAEPIADAKGKGKSKGKGSAKDNSVVEAKVEEAPSSESQAVAEPIADAKGEGKSKDEGASEQLAPEAAKRAPNSSQTLEVATPNRNEEVRRSCNIALDAAKAAAKYEKKKLKKEQEHKEKEHNDMLAQAIKAANAAKRAEEGIEQPEEESPVFIRHRTLKVATQILSDSDEDEDEEPENVAEVVAAEVVDGKGKDKGDRKGDQPAIDDDSTVAPRCSVSSRKTVTIKEDGEEVEAPRKVTIKDIGDGDDVEAPRKSILSSKGDQPAIDEDSTVAPRCSVSSRKTVTIKEDGEEVEAPRKVTIKDGGDGDDVVSPRKSILSSKGDASRKSAKSVTISDGAKRTSVAIDGTLIIEQEVDVVRASDEAEISRSRTSSQIHAAVIASKQSIAEQEEILRTVSGNIRNSIAESERSRRSRAESSASQEARRVRAESRSLSRQTSKLSLPEDVLKDISDDDLPDDETGPTRWTIVVDRVSGDELGIDLDYTTLEINLLRTVGLIFEWNNKHPKRAVRAGDRIVEVNGKKGTLVLSECVQRQALRITIERPSADQQKELVTHFELIVGEDVQKMGWASTGLPPERVFVSQVMPQGWGAENSLKPGDEIVSTFGRFITEMSKEEFLAAVKRRPLHLTFARKADELAETHTPATSSRSGLDSDGYSFSATVEEGVSSLGWLSLGLPPQRIFVSEIDSGSWASRAGLRKFDELTHIDDAKVDGFTPQEFLQAVKRRPLQLKFHRHAKPPQAPTSERSLRLALPSERIAAQALACAPTRYSHIANDLPQWKDWADEMRMRTGWSWRRRFFQLSRCRLSMWNSREDKEAEQAPTVQFPLVDGGSRWAVQRMQGTRFDLQFQRGPRDKRPKQVERYVFQTDDEKQTMEITKSIWYHVRYSDYLAYWPMPYEGRQCDIRHYGIEYPSDG